MFDRILTLGRTDLWADTRVIREELFGIERLEHHAQSLAAAQQIKGGRRKRGVDLIHRMTANSAALLRAYRSSAEALDAGEAITPAAEWLLDNFHIVEQHLRQVEADLPPEFYRDLPKLADGPFAGHPRIFGVAWAYVAHTDSLLSTSTLLRFLLSYQSVQPLTIGELWASAITLRIVLIENMRRLAVQTVDAHRMRRAADMLVDRVVQPSESGKTAHAILGSLDQTELPAIMVAQIAKRLRSTDPGETPLAAWLDERLRRLGLSLDEAVANAQAEQGAANVTMRNIVTSLRRLSEMDWRDFFENASLVEARLRHVPGYPEMDFPTRNRYRTAIEKLARGSGQSEIAVTEAAIAAAETEPDGDPGQVLIGDGQQRLKNELGYRVSWREGAWGLLAGTGLAGYLTAIALVTVGILALTVWVAGPSSWIVVLCAGVIASDAGVALINIVLTRVIRPEPLPALELEQGVPPHLRTLVAVPVIVSDLDELNRLIEQIEVHYLASAGGAVHFALLVDGPDADTETTPLDEELVAVARGGIARLNAVYPSDDGDRFHVLHRRRRWNAAEGKWMGWERKRGKLLELNRLLRGQTDTSFLPAPSLPADTKYVITLDADTRILRDSVRRLVGKMAHPLNRPVINEALQRVTGGHAILQPQVIPSLPVGADGSLYHQVFSAPGGIEPYAAASSDIYQDLFGEGSFTGKGIYDVDAFMAAMDGRVPDNAMLSHDLFEGAFARAGFASDVQVMEDFPARYDVDARRLHRWIRGDWQLLPWITGVRSTVGGIAPLTLWKMLDNLRRSLIAPVALLAVFLSWFHPLPVAVAWTLAILILLVLPRLFMLPLAVLPGRAGLLSRSHLQAFLQDIRLTALQIGLTIVLLAETAAQALDAILRTLVRLQSGRHLLQWMTAAHAGGSGLPRLDRYYLERWRGVILAAVVCGAAVVINTAVWPLVLVFALAWSAAPALARWISQPSRGPTAAPLNEEGRAALRLIARRTWRYFETFVTEENHFLPPDNFQEIPRRVVARRTSPTNIGLYLLSVTVARDMGWIGTAEAVTRLRQTLDTVSRMPHYRGHLFNWYDTGDLRVLDPPYVSTVDSGNLAGHLIALAQICHHWETQAEPPGPLGIQDAANQALLCVDEKSDLELVDAIRAGINSADHAERAVRMAQDRPDPTGDLLFWVQAVLNCHRSRAHDGVSVDELRDLGHIARQMALAMEFDFLVQEDKKLLSIGFSVATNALDPSCYDLLASEARLASFFAIAKGDVHTRHWFRLGRASTPIGTGSALISWSGSMFEYLMPSLVMRAPAGSVLEETNRRIVGAQRNYARSLGLPWGISESAYNARDPEMTYQYSNFGVPGLGLKRGLGENRVISPYATALAAMVDPQQAIVNFRALAELGAEGRFGFYEALDFTASRVPAGSRHVIVQNFMAHHQGMTIVGIANALLDGCMRDRFHAEPIIKATELLLQERVPRDMDLAPARAKEVHVAARETETGLVVRIFPNPAREDRTAHLLSNGRYGVMLTPSGAGFSRWGDLAITRWRADQTRANYGSFLYFRDVRSGGQWTAGALPMMKDLEHKRAEFCEHHASFTHRARLLTTKTEVVVSAEDDAEARRVTLSNTGRHEREIEITSYAELVLAPLAADQAHPAFSKMFVVTDHIPELGVLIATRRKRSPSDPDVWAAHIAVVEGEETAAPEFETDRARFIGRGRTMADPVSLGTALSGSTGTVLDPIFSLRRRVRIPGGASARITFWTMAASSPEALLDLVDRHRSPSAFGRAVTLAWTQAQVQLRHLAISTTTAMEFQKLAGMIVRGAPRLRASDAQIRNGAGPQSDLWPLGISGDQPIVLFLISDIEDIARLHEVLAAVEYWRLRQLVVDLVIYNDRASSYVQDLQVAIDAAVRSAQPRAGTGAAPGAVFTLRNDFVPQDTREHLMAAAAVVLFAGRGTIGAQLDALPPSFPQAAGQTVSRAKPDRTGTVPVPQLEFFNGTGGFDHDGREYVVVLRDGQTTPAPWINVVANPHFGFQISADGSGFTWSRNSRENQVTAWSNDPVIDPAGEAIYLKDLETGSVWTPTALPVRGRGTYVVRHGFGYSTFEHAANEIESRLIQFVPQEESVKISQLTLRNTSGRVRRISVTAYVEWVLGSSRAATAPGLITEIDKQTGAILARNPRSMSFSGRVAFADLGAQVSSRSCDRAEILGLSGSVAAPERLDGLSGRDGPRLDPCAALQRVVTLSPGQSVEVVFLLGQSESTHAAQELIASIRQQDLTKLLKAVTDRWNRLLGTVQIQTPDRAMDIMVNGWLLYQAIACRLWARSGFYQASGAFGFRDQLQDGMALAALHPDMTREHLLLAASRQFPEGDFQHWWLPESGQGVRTRISDDRVWLAHAVAQYVDVSGDTAILDVKVPFLGGPELRPADHDSFFKPEILDTQATIFEHCARGLDQAVAMTGENGMPLIGTGDWNDGMNRVGEEGRGTSVWLGWFLIATINAMLPLAKERDPERAARWQDHAERVRKAIEQDGWDGNWYRRGTFDDGSPLGSAMSDECQIDSIAQSWAVLSGAASADRARQAMEAVNKRLIDGKIVRLFTPPFDQTQADPGYIKGYPPGLRENGGQYSHAAMWAILAHAKLGNGDEAASLFSLVNPINHALSAEDAALYKVEPYVVAADVYAAQGHFGRGGWTWYTGSAAWMYRAGVEGILGMSRRGDEIHFAPCLPKSWPEVKVTLNLAPAHCVVTFDNRSGAGSGIVAARLNGESVEVSKAAFSLPLSRMQGNLLIELG